VVLVAVGGVDGVVDVMVGVEEGDVLVDAAGPDVALVARPVPRNQAEVAR
jgi:hypothetical protein